MRQTTGGARGLGKPETFNFLGFTHISGHSRRGGFQLKRKSRSDRVRAKLKVVKEALRRRMHETIDEQGTWLRRVVMGFNASPCRADQFGRTWGLPLQYHQPMAARTV